ncbi:MAG: TetR/AcrR family transcriptional regulator [Bacteroidetes bacterium]|nr:TetR/AcrR family transcriptional regulator [Bacteroidota bacterium]
MPSETFNNLNPVKKKAITDAFLREFAIKTYDEASISKVVRQLGIAKGSIYQYFDGKLGLFLYLSDAATQVKMKYVAGVQRSDFPDYWTFFRKLYEDGINFDLENPLESHFLHNLRNSLNSPSVADLYAKFMDQTLAAFRQMVKHEMDIGLFRSDLPLDTAAFFIYKSSLAIYEHMEIFVGLSPKERIAQNRSVFDGMTEKMLQVVDQYIALMKNALENPNL